MATRVPLLALAALLLVAFAASAEEGAPRIGRFSATGLEGWRVKSFRGETAYRIVEEEGRRVLQAESRGSASGLIHDVAYDPKDFPVLTWSWKIAGVVAAGDGRTRAGDDYAARVYVIFPHWFFPKTRTLNYIWANRLPQGTVLPNAYTGNAMMIAVESGPERAGAWVSERRDIVADYRRAFGEEPPPVGAIAVMTDSDDTGGAATAWYGDLAAGRER